MEKSITQYIIVEDAPIMSALKQMDRIGTKLLIVVKKDNKFRSLLSIGDIQRALIKKIALTEPVLSILRESIKIAHVKDDLDKVKADMIRNMNEYMPLLNDNGEAVQVIFFKDLFDGAKIEKKQLNLPVVIMAGGKGDRLKPITNILPKALIPIGEKSILELIMDKFVEVGCNMFYLSVNYKAEMIKYYLSTLNQGTYNISFFQEEKPLGTAGSLFLLKKRINSTFFVSNCDIIIDQEIQDIVNYHRESKNLLTIVAALKNYKIPYGTIETAQGGMLLALNEKPELTFQLNTGFYILEPELFDMIPENTFFHITELIEKVKRKSSRVGVFPISEGSWEDVGDWNAYLKNNIK